MSFLNLCVLHFFLHCIRYSNLFASIILGVSFAFLLLFPDKFLLEQGEQVMSFIL